MRTVRGNNTEGLPMDCSPPVVVLVVHPWRQVYSIWDPAVLDWLRDASGRRRAWSIKHQAEAVAEILGD